MKLENCQPGSEIASFINSIVSLEVNEKDQSTIEIYPSGYSYLTHSYCNTGIYHNQKRRERLPEVFISGQATNNYINIKVNEKLCHFGIEFRPTGFYRLFDYPMHTLTNSYGHFVKKVPKSILEQQNFDDKCRDAERWLSKLAKNAKEPSYVDQAVALIEEEPTRKIAEIGEEVGISRRQLRRDFLEEVGIAPKTYAQIRQIKQVYKLISQNNEEKLKDYAYQCGYYDVAHFIKAFKQFVGKRPSAFLENYNGYIDFYLAENRDLDS